MSSATKSASSGGKAAGGKAPAKKVRTGSGNLSTLALVMMNVTVLAGLALSNIPSALISAGQDPMGMPIKHPYGKDEMINLPNAKKDPKAQAAAAAELLAKHGITEPSEPKKVSIVGDATVGVKLVSYAPSPVHTDKAGNSLPDPTSEDVANAPIPHDPHEDAQRALAEARLLDANSTDMLNEAKALTDEAQDDQSLAKDAHQVQVDEAQAKEAAAAINRIDPTDKTSALPKPAKPAQGATGSTKPASK
ncbi:MAG: hypothetical protein UHD09_08880 [Bifidobacterium sp.]|nr:hypothetical protein [Bifidobacterium sp.]